MVALSAKQQVLGIEQICRTEITTGFKKYVQSSNEKSIRKEYNDCDLKTHLNMLTKDQSNMLMFQLQSSLRCFSRLPSHRAALFSRRCHWIPNLGRTTSYVISPSFSPSLFCSFQSFQSSIYSLRLDIPTGPRESYADRPLKLYQKTLISDPGEQAPLAMRFSTILPLIGAFSFFQQSTGMISIRSSRQS